MSNVIEYPTMQIIKIQLTEKNWFVRVSLVEGNLQHDVKFTVVNDGNFKCANQITGLFTYLNLYSSKLKKK